MSYWKRLVTGTGARFRRWRKRWHRAVVLAWLSRGMSVSWIRSEPIDHPKPTFSDWPLLAAVAVANLDACDGVLDVPRGTPEESIESIAQRCHGLLGIWPISFSYPSECVASPSQERSQLVSKIIPGLPYGFHEEDAYRSEYENSYYAVTHKKGGWDCFRHLEILSAGTLPLMPDALDIPEFSMVHYPRALLRTIAIASDGCLPVPSDALRCSAKNFFNENLTTRAMANYVATRFSGPPPQSVLLIDTYGRWDVNHLGAMTYIGFEQLTHGNCSSFLTLPYIYRGWQGNAHGLYGRGFGYTRVLNGEMRKRSIQMKGMVNRLRTQDFDLVLFGSIVQDWKLFEYLLPYLDRRRTALIVGEDVPSPERVLDKLRSTGCEVFVRSIE